MADIYVSEKELLSAKINLAQAGLGYSIKSLEQHDNEIRQKIFHESYEQGKFDARADFLHDKEVEKRVAREIIEQVIAWNDLSINANAGTVFETELFVEHTRQNNLLEELKKKYGIEVETNGSI